MKTEIYNHAIDIITEITSRVTNSQPGGLPWLLVQKEKPSIQSVYIKIGRNFEKWFKYIVEWSGMKLLPDGVIKNVDGSKSKDIDLIFVDEDNKIIYYRELKSNLELDTEKLPATLDKIEVITEYILKQYPGYKIDFSLLHWSVYEPSILPKKYQYKINTCKKKGVDVTYPKDLFNTISINISEDEWYSMWLDIDKIIKS